MSESFFVIGLHKAGSVLLNNVAEEICKEIGFPTVQIEGSLFAAGINHRTLPQSEVDKLDRIGFVYTTCRTIHIVERMKIYNNSKKLLLVRDPRDAAVSSYFSGLYSHPRPGEGGGIAQKFDARRAAFAQETPSSAILNGRMNVLFDNQLSVANYKRDMSHLTCMRYEDIIFDKKTFVSDIVDWFGAELGPAKVTAIAERFDVVPTEEDPFSHIRQVKPGNYKKHLNEQATSYIEEYCRDFFISFGYPFSVQ